MPDRSHACFSQIEYVFSSNHMSVKFKELSSYYKLLFMLIVFVWFILTSSCL